MLNNLMLWCWNSLIAFELSYITTVQIVFLEADSNAFQGCIYWFGAQKTFLIVNVENCYEYVETYIFLEWN